MTSGLRFVAQGRGSSAAASTLAVLVFALLGAYVALALAVHDNTALGIPGALPVDAAVAAAAGFVVLSQRHHHPAGWAMVAAGVIVLLQTDGVLLSIVHYRNHTDPLPLGGPAVLAGLLWAPALLLVPPAILHFPDGRVPVRRRRAVLRLYVIFGAATCTYFYARAIEDLTGGGFSINPSTGDLAEFDNPSGSLALVYAGWAVLVLSGLAAAIAILVTKFRRSDGDTRQQLRWFLFGSLLVTSAILPVVIISSLGLPAGSPANQLPALYLALALAALPLTILVGILRYRLYDLNLVISRSIAYGVLAACITGIYLSAVALLGLLVHHGSANLGVSILATLVSAAAFQPLRTRAQRLADRLVYGHRATPYEAVIHLADQLAGAYDVSTVLTRVARVLVDATGAQRADVWLRSEGDALRPFATWPPEADWPEPLAVEAVQHGGIDARRAVAPVRHQNALLGALTVTKRPDETPTETEMRLLGHLASQAGLVLHNAKLSADLQQRLDELLASRQRLVSVQDEARRRLERDLHDGAQQQLITLGMSIARLRAHLAESDDEADVALARMQGAVDETLESIRALSRGIYPPLLADRGMAAALRSHVRNAPVPVVVESTLSERCAREVEAATYFCVLEALQNVYRHAAASRARVLLCARDGFLRVQIADDGRGFDVARSNPGSGLTNMVDRVDALGGALSARSTPGTGATIEIEIPLAS